MRLNEIQPPYPSVLSTTMADINKFILSSLRNLSDFNSLLIYFLTLVISSILIIILIKNTYTKNKFISQAVTNTMPNEKVSYSCIRYSCPKSFTYHLPNL